jgi:hypothetical protein
MHIGRSYKLAEFLDWTRRDVYTLILFGIVPVVGYQIGDQKWLGIPWTVVALLGTATAFIVGFKNLQTYNRAWEARQIRKVGSSPHGRLVGGGDVALALVLGVVALLALTPVLRTAND